GACRGDVTKKTTIFAHWGAWGKHLSAKRPALSYKKEARAELDCSGACRVQFEGCNSSPISKLFDIGLARAPMPD
ncbi:hypothetical protein, partial [Pseudomonas sp. FYR_11]|uniref:hypothetical protein n=1 Tax=Pseudomonas TaxID=286 RepID=UPI00370A6F91